MYGGFNARDYDRWLESPFQQMCEAQERMESLEEDWWDTEECCAVFQQWERDCYAEYDRSVPAWDTWLDTKHYRDAFELWASKVLEDERDLEEAYWDDRAQEWKETTSEV